MTTRPLFLGIVTLCAAFLGGSQAVVGRKVENDIEVVLNHKTPYKIGGSTVRLSLEEAFRIDTENDAVAAAGVTDIYRFDAAADGTVFILAPPTGPRNIIHKFSSTGTFLGSFGRKGQGPGELEYPSDILSSPQGVLWVLESPKNKIHVFSAEGKFLESLNPAGFEDILPLPGGNRVLSRLEIGDGKSRYFSIELGLYDANFTLVKALDRFDKAPNNQIYKGVPERYVNGIYWIFLAKTSQDRVFIGNSERGYEIRVFGLDGRLLRIVRKEYTPVAVSEAYKKETLKPYEEGMPDYARKIFFPDYWHAYQGFFPDEQGRLFVVTYEPGERPREFWTDIFDASGSFVARYSLPVYSAGRGLVMARVRGERLYLVQEKDNGFKQLAAYRMVWK